MEHDLQGWDQLGKDFDAGIPIPAADPKLLKKLWEGMKQMGPEESPFRPSDKAMGLGAFGLCPGDLENRPHSDFLCAWLRSFILAALDGRGTLQEFKVDNTYSDRVFDAIATFPCAKSEISECVMLRMMADDPGDKWEETRRQATVHGYDFSKPEIDSKFLAYLEQRASESSG